MDETLVNFLLGAFFSYGSSFAKENPLGRIFSISSLFVFSFSYIKKNCKNDNLNLSILNSKLILQCASLSILEYLLISYFVPSLKHIFVAKIGSVLLFAGFFLSVYSLYFLGNSSGFLNTGPYALVRHPVYLGLVLYVAGCLVYCGCLVSVPAFLYFVKIEFVNKIADEEKVLVDRYKEYGKYREEVCSGIPFL